MGDAQVRVAAESRVPHPASRFPAVPPESRDRPPAAAAVPGMRAPVPARRSRQRLRSEEHTSELQSLAYLVCRLLLEKKKHQLRQPGAQQTAFATERVDLTVGPDAAVRVAYRPERQHARRVPTRTNGNAHDDRVSGRT